MCAGIEIPGSRSVLERQGELAKALGRRVSQLPFKGGYTNTDGSPYSGQYETCLCPVDFQELANRNGWELDYTTDPFNVIARNK